MDSYSSIGAQAAYGLEKKNIYLFHEDSLHVSLI